MKVYQRMVYVGLGGTGVRIGTAVERELRRGLCGPDGGQLVTDYPSLGLGLWELPEYIRFVYADFDKSELSGAQSSSGLDSQLWQRSSKIVSKMVPVANSSKQVSQSLRVNELNGEFSWLPPESSDPHVAPLSDGAGQFPTVGRAALHASIMDANSMSSVTGPILAALTDVARGGGQISELTGKPAEDGIDVFVGFSVAGGTGCGIFYDFLHFISHLAAKEFPTLQTKIYPLVLLPSTIGRLNDQSKRAADLNGSRALLDLLRLVDSQNMDSDLPSVSVWDGSKRDFQKMTIPAATVRTAFLFSRPQLMQPSDVTKSVVTFVESMVSTEQTEKETSNVMSFASQFVNRAAQSNSDHPLGIGRGPASTTVAASISVPVERVARTLAEHLLADAIRDAKSTRAGESNARLRRQFLGTAGLSKLVDQDKPPLSAPDTSIVGAKAIAEQYTARTNDAKSKLGLLKRKLEGEFIPPMVTFDWQTGLSQLFQQAGTDPFLVARVILGDPSLKGEDQGGVVGYLSERAQPVNPPGTIKEIPEVRDRAMGAIKAKFSEAADDFEMQERWYQMHVDALWRTGWAAQSARWGDTVARMRKKLNDILDGFRRFEAQEATSYAAACAELYSDQRAEVLLVPDGGPDHRLDQLSDMLRMRLMKQFGSESGTALQLATALLGSSGWGESVKHQIDNPEGKAVDWVLSRLEAAMVDGLTRKNVEGVALMPRLMDQLYSASLPDTSSTEADRALRPRVAGALGKLNLSGIQPQGVGQLEVVVTYPSVAEDNQIEEFLRQHMTFDLNSTIDFVPSQADRLVVTQTRFGQGFLDTEEVRSLVQLWAAATRDPQRQDVLDWRQRTGFGDPFLMMSVGDRVRLWARIFNAILGGTFSIIDGDALNPKVLRFALPKNANAAFDMQLSPKGGMSGWTDIANAYERVVLGAEGGPARTVIERFMSVPAPCFADDDPTKVRSDAVAMFAQFEAARADDLERLRSRLDGNLTQNVRQVYENLVELLDVQVERAMDEQIGSGYSNTVRLVLDTVEKG